MGDRSIIPARGAVQRTTVGARLPPPDDEAVRAFTAAARPPGTLRVYSRDWRTFVEWLDANGHPHPRRDEPYAARIVAGYLTALAQSGYKASTISHHLATICVAFEHLGIASPRTRVEDTLSGIRRALGTAQDQKVALTTDLLARLIAATPATTVEGVRDRAVLLFGFCTALRRSDIAGTTWDELSLDAGGYLFRTRRRMKHNQEGEWHSTRLSRVDSAPDLCPVRALGTWLVQLRRRLRPGDPSRAIFRRLEADGSLGLPFAADGSDVHRIVKSAARRVGLDPRMFGGHSLRAS